MEGDYRVTGQQHVNRYDANSSSITRGWWVYYIDNRTKVASSVFVPDDQYPDNTKPLILAEIADIRRAHSETG